MPTPSKRRTPPVGEDRPGTIDGADDTDTGEPGTTPTRARGKKRSNPTARPQRSPRTSRAQEKRAVTPSREKEKPFTSRPDLLAAPEPRPGMSQRWMSISELAGSERKLLWKMQREGWQPRMASTAPEYRGATMAHGTWQGAIVSGDVILCEIPTERLEATRGAEIARKTARQRASVDENLFTVEDPRLGRIRKQHKRQARFGQRRSDNGGDDAAMFDDGDEGEEL